MNIKALMKCGFSKDINNSELIRVFQDNAKFKEVYIDIYSNDPFDNTVRPILLLRCSEKNVSIVNDGNNIVLRMSDKYNTYISEIKLNNIKENYFKCFKKSVSSCSEFVLNYQNIYYKIIIFK